MPLYSKGSSSWPPLSHYSSRAAAKHSGILGRPLKWWYLLAKTFKLQPLGFYTLQNPTAHMGLGDIMILLFFLIPIYFFQYRSISILSWYLILAECVSVKTRLYDLLLWSRATSTRDANSRRNASIIAWLHVHCHASMSTADLL